MKRALILTLAALSALHTAQAETTESNVTIQFKLQTRNEPAVIGKNLVINFTTVTYKTSDVIARIVEAEETPAFTSKAKLIYRYTYAPGSETRSYIIREKGFEDYTVRNNVFGLDFGDHINPVIAPYTLQSKRTTAAPYTGTGNFRGYGIFSWRPNNTFLELEMHGTFADKYRYTASKQHEDQSYSPPTISISGIGTFNLNPETSSNLQGVVEGTVKFSAPKLLKTEPSQPQ